MAANLILSSLLFLVVSSSASSFYECGEKDTTTLLKIKDSFSDSPSVASWNRSTNCCNWKNVGCNGDGTIIYVNIFDSSYSGPLPETFGDLPALIDLYITKVPNLSGPIPSFVAELTALKSITITNTSLSGHIPSFLCDLPVFYSIDLSANNLTGSIPNCFGSKFASINFGQNRLSGPIPANLFHGKTIFGGLIALNLYDNQLTGQIPRSLKDVKFDTINLSGNRLTGDASFLFGTKKTTQHFDLSRNELEFDLSSVKFPVKMRWLDISRNRVTGSIPKQITKLRTLYLLNVSYNELCGPIPSGGMMNDFDRSAFDHNKCLCGAPLSPCNGTVGN